MFAKLNVLWTIYIPASFLLMSSLRALFIWQNYFWISVILSQIPLFAPSLVMRRWTLWKTGQYSLDVYYIDKHIKIISLLYSPRTWLCTNLLIYNLHTPLPTCLPLHGEHPLCTTTTSNQSWRLHWLISGGSVGLCQKQCDDENKTSKSTTATPLPGLWQISLNVECAFGIQMKSRHYIK